MPYKFTSKELDPETGLYYFGARYYDARVSRWISPDPILYKYLPKVLNGDQAKNYNLNFPGDDFYNSENLNLYGYGYNNPIVYVDPNGKFVIKVPFSDKYFYFQQKPRDSKGNFKGFRFGLTTEKEGRYIDPTGGGVLGLGIVGRQKISFINDDASKPTTDRKVSFKLAQALENIAGKHGLSFNINSSVRGPGQGYHSSGNAVDINMVANSGGSQQFHDANSNRWNSPLSVDYMRRHGNFDIIESFVNAFHDEGGLEILSPLIPKQKHPDHIHAGNVQ